MASKVGFFLGTFDPIHNGHVAVIKKVLEEKLVDYVIVVPCPQNPWKKNKPVNLGLRYWMCMAAIEGIDKVYVETGTNFLWDDAGLEFSYQQLQAILKKGKWYKDKELYIICGTDVYDNIKYWKNSEWILENFKLIGINRPNYAEEADPNIPELCSSDIRARKVSLEDNVPERVAKLIKQYKLYETK